VGHAQKKAQSSPSKNTVSTLFAEKIKHPLLDALFVSNPTRPGSDRDKTRPAERQLSGSPITEVKVDARPCNSHSNQITTVVKIGSPFKLKFDARKAFLGDVFLGVAQPAWMREADHPYTLVVTLLKKQRRFPRRHTLAL
jgi:hypothetical protein